MPSAEEYLIRIQLQIQNDKALKAMTSELDRAARQAPKTERAMRTVATGTRQFGNVAQNAGYQVQDFIVQVQGGTDPMRALSQQLPQLTVGMGAMGAAIGIAAAAIPALITYFSDAEESAEDFDKSLDALNGSLEDAASVAEGIDLTNWIDEWNKASGSVREARLELLQFNTAAAQNELDNALKNLGASQAEEAGETFATMWMQGYSDYLVPAFKNFSRLYTGAAFTGGEGPDSQTRALQNFADTMGNLDLEAARELNNLLLDYRSGVTSIDQLADSVIQFGQDSQNATGPVKQLVDQIRAAQQAARDVEDLQDLVDRASGGGQLAGGSEPKKSRSGREPRDRTREIQRERLAAVNAMMKQNARYLEEQAKAAKLAEEEQRKLVDLWARANPELARFHEEVTFLNQAYEAGFISQEKFAQGTANAQARLNESLEGWTVGKEALDIFKQSFDTLTDGILLGTRDAADAVKDMAKVMIAQFLKLMAYEGIFRALGGSGGSFLNTIGNSFANGGAGLTASARGNAFSGGHVIPFARGGIVSGPTVFPMARGMGLMGEAGPEAVMPLKRGADGRLGVSGGGMNVTINNMAQGVDVVPRQTENGLTLDVVMRAVAQDIQRGGGMIPEAMERSYGVRRGRQVY